jgi:outer membrane protein OmpA-like peptidoglycan-associated protein
MSKLSALLVAATFAFALPYAHAEHLAARDADPCADSTECARVLAKTLTSQTAKLQLRKVVTFEAGRVRVYSTSREKIQAIAESWKRNSDWKTIEVEGYSDAHGRSDAENIALGQERADKVRAYLIRYGVAPAYVVAVGRSHATGEAGAMHVDLAIETCTDRAACARH